MGEQIHGTRGSGVHLILVHTTRVWHAVMVETVLVNRESKTEAFTSLLRPDTQALRRYADFKAVSLWVSSKSRSRVSRIDVPQVEQYTFDAD